MISWSYSRLLDFEGCPQKFRFKHINRIPDAPGPALVRGTKIHEIAESYVKAPSKSAGVFPSPLAKFKEKFVVLRHIEASTEAEWGFDSLWRPLHDWFHPTTRVRIKADAHYTKKGGYGFVVDYKTGRIYSHHIDQLNLYSVGMLKREPTLKHVVAEAWYLDLGLTKTYLLKKSGLAAAIKYWNKRAAPLLREKTFAPTPGEACRFCPYAKSKGGPCEYA